MDTQPKIPTLKDSQKPQVKVRGLEAGATLFDRLKQFKKKDLAFILAGLGTLFMAPLAEHFMMSPEGGDATLNQGFGKGGAGSGAGIFGGNGPASYDSANGLAPGSAVGGGSDVITPLNVRDPSALIMGPNATPQPPTNSVAPPTAPPTAPSKSDSDLRDALAASAARGVGGATKAAKALLPVPKVALGGSGLRGLGVSSGGSSASASLAPISSAGIATGKAAESNSLGNVKKAAGYGGVARGPGTGGSGGLEALKKAAGDVGDGMNRGSAATALDNSAAAAIPNGGASFGGNGAGGSAATDKGFGGDGNKDSRSTGESLEFLKQKAMQDAKIALWAKEQEAGDGKLEMLKIRNSIAEAIGSKIGDAMGSFISCPMSQSKNGGLKGFGGCWTNTAADPDFICDADGGGHMTIPSAAVVDGCSVAGKSADSDQSTTYVIRAGQAFQCSGTTEQHPAIAKNCDTGKLPKGGSSDPKNNRSVTGAGPTTSTDLMGDDSVKGLEDACGKLSALSSTMGKLNNPDVQSSITALKAHADSGIQRAARIVAIRDAIAGPSSTAGNACNATKVQVSGPIQDQHVKVLQALVDTTVPNSDGGPNGLIPKLGDALKIPDAPKDGQQAPASPDPSKIADSKSTNDPVLGVPVDAAIDKVSADVKAMDNAPKPEDVQIAPASDTDFQKVYKSVYALPAEAVNGKIQEAKAAFDSINNALTKVNKAKEIADGIQKDLDQNKARLDNASGPNGFVAKTVPVDGNMSKVMQDEVFPKAQFQLGDAKIVPVDVTKGNTPGKPDVAAADKSVTTGAQSFNDTFKPAYQANPTDPKVLPGGETFKATNGALNEALTSLNKARTAEGGELGSLYTTFSGDQKKLSAAPASSGTPSAAPTQTASAAPTPTESGTGEEE